MIYYALALVAWITYIEIARYKRDPLFNMSELDKATRLIALGYVVQHFLGW